MEVKKRIYDIIENKRSMMISMQKELTAVPAMAPQNGGDGEWEKAQKLIEWIDRCGITEVERINAPDERVSSGRRPNIIATIPGKSTEKTFWVMTHLDVVPPGDINLWNTDPFTVKEMNGRLIGRGVEDNQQGLVSSLFAASSLLEAKVVPPFTVKLLFVSDEETGSIYGIKHLLEHYNLFRQTDIILVPDGGDRDATMIEIAEKNLLWLQLRTIGKQCHASIPEHGNNAFVAGSDLALRLYRLNEEYSQTDPIFDPPNSTFSPTKKEANVPNINTIPGDDIFYLDCRILPSIDVDDVLQRINAIIHDVEESRGVQIALTVIQRVSSPPTPKDSPLVPLLKNSIKEVYGKKAVEMGIGGGTVAGHLRRKGYETVVWSKIEETAHMPNEYCIIDNMVGDAKVMASIMTGE
ncbi:MAG: M20 family metallo-hydrolase [Spirochaetales bacterium]|nr:M20 family metallo-hydrolase [Spirochaetales bacterium]